LGITKRRAIAAGVALAVIVGVLFYLGYIWPQEGPLGYRGGNRAIMKRAGSDNTAAFHLSSDERIVLEGVEPIGLDSEGEGKVLGSGIAEHCLSESQDNCHWSLISRGWPPKGVAPAPVEGYVVEPGKPVHILLGLRFIPRRPAYGGKLEKGEATWDDIQIRGIVLRYKVGMRHFRTEVGPEAVFKRYESGD
jgi:hypothetical protein